MAIEFQRNYQLLELDPGSDWASANRNYRRLVHAWHPDRFEQRPGEREQAQKQFIELTKAFNNLRAFYRENHRLPFETIKQAVADPPEPPEHQKVKPKDEVVMKSGMLNKRKPSPLIRRPGMFKPLLWALPIGASIVAGIAVFVVIDRNAKQNTIEEAKRVLRNVQPSEYMRDSEKISQANSRAVLINQSSDGKLGDKLAKDVFK